MATEVTWRLRKQWLNFYISNDHQPDSSSCSLSILMRLHLNSLRYEWSSTFNTYARVLQPQAEKSRVKDDSFMCQELIERWTRELDGTNNRIKVLSNLGNITVDFADDEIIFRSAPSGVRLLDLINYCPGRLVNDRIRLLILYQVLSSLDVLHSHGLPHLGIELSGIYVDDRYDCTLKPPDPDVLRLFCPSQRIGQIDESERAVHVSGELCGEQRLLSTMVSKWVLRQITNFDYLMFLNSLAGRRIGDPSNSAILPWVVDFTHPQGGFRDLTKSMYHLNKGEAQLDANFNSHSKTIKVSAFPTLKASIVPNFEFVCDQLNKFSVSNGDFFNHSAESQGQSKAQAFPPGSLEKNVCESKYLEFQPHHLLDTMSDLTYYTYMARRTCKTTLIKYVRPVFQPHEFPATMARLYETTPDESIPEFYTDPTVFDSIHPDMPDLSLPSWCKTSEEFIRYHRTMLESETVSSMLHHWIDLTFGYKLLGKAAVTSKNVHLEMVDAQKFGRTSGIRCLFTTPHPHRLSAISAEKYFGPTLPLFDGRVMENSSGSKLSVDEAVDQACAHHNDHCTQLHLPSDYNPLALINCYQNLCMFLVSETHPLSWPIELEKHPPKQRPVSLKAILDRDVESFGCLAVELFTYPMCNVSEIQFCSHTERVRKARSNMRSHHSYIPNCLHDGLSSILQPWADHPIDHFIPSVHQLLGLLFKFPQSISDLYVVIRWLTNLRHQSPYSEFQMTPLSNCGQLAAAFLNFKFPPNAEHVEPFYLSSEVLHLLHPHVVKTAQMCPWWLLDALQSGRILRFYAMVGGVQAVKKFLLPSILSLYNMDSVHSFNVHHGSRKQHPMSILCSIQFLRSLLTHLDVKTFMEYLPHFLLCGLLNDSHRNSCQVDSLNQPEYGQSIDPTDGQSISIGSDRKCDRSDEIELDPGNLEEENDSSLLFTGSPTTLTILEPLPSKSSCAIRVPVTPMNNPINTSGCLNSNVGANSPNRLADCPLSATNERLEQNLQPLNPKGDCSVIAAEKDEAVPYPIETVINSVVWLAKRMGPVWSGKCLVQYLVSVIVSCCEHTSFLNPLQPVTNVCGDLSSNRPIPTQSTNHRFLCDYSAGPSLLCLEKLVQLYGMSLVELVYFPLVSRSVDACLFTIETLATDEATTDQISNVSTKSSPLPTACWNTRMFSKLLASLTILCRIMCYIPDSMLSDYLESSVLQDLTIKTIRIAGRRDSTFPFGALGRRAVLYRLVNCLHVIGLRIGFEMTRTHMTPLFQVFFALFDCVSSLKKCAGSIMQQPLNPLIADELLATFTGDVAFTAYVSFCRLSGGAYLDTCLYNAPYIHSLIKQTDQPESDSMTSLNVLAPSRTGKEDLNLLHRSVIHDGDCRLRGVWLDLFRAELNPCSLESSAVQFNGNRVATFTGHSDRITFIHMMGTGNCFLTSSTDKTVQLWSLTDAYNPGPNDSSNVVKTSHGRNTPVMDATPNMVGEGSINPTVGARVIYRGHKRPVFGAVYLENYRLVASCDGHLILWDPCTGVKVRSEFVAHDQMTAMTTSPVPHGGVVCSDSHGQIYLIDPRTAHRMQYPLLHFSTGSSKMLSSLAAVRKSDEMKKTAAGDMNIHSKHDVLTCQFQTLWSQNESQRPTLPMSIGSPTQLAACGTSNTLWCGFSSGLMMACDLRQFQPVKIWQAHADSVLQLENFDSNRFLSIGDRSLTFWHMDKDLQPISYDPHEHSIARTSNESNTVLPWPGQTKLTCFAPMESDVFVCGPAVTNPATITDHSQLSGRLLLGPSANSISSSNRDLLGIYRSTQNDGIPQFSPLGRISSNLLRGRVSALVALPYIGGALLTGSTQGALVLLH